ncbi:TolC family protein [Lacibacter luteus]|uniref:TolC family protein n=1 Tax=Lacibacter luteus TaxID=2508719 RepID=A0A4Q1CIW9_9BACT|nr:TolC family protein [Lacibacter luteus]RXK60581.1 TolC family protein [Lacibacter luteus]
MYKKKQRMLLIIGILTSCITQAQELLTLKGAVDTAVKQYGTIKAKNHYAKASAELIEQAKRDYLPNLNVAAQQVYGTINGQNGPLYGFGLSAASSGLPLAHQSWNAAFGALYLTNINWDFYAFGRADQKIKVAQANTARDVKDYEQEIFQHKIKVAAAYLNLLAAHQLSYSYQKNLDRADTLRRIVITRTKNGLVAGVDSSLANADYSNAKILLTRAVDAEQQQKNILLQLLGGTVKDFVVDTSLLTRVPTLVQSIVDTAAHPLLQFYKSRLLQNEAQLKLTKKSFYPAFTLVGVWQARGSGFESGYVTDQTLFTHNYFTGVKPVRHNYLIGVGVTWNLTQPYRLTKQLHAQQLIGKGLQEEYNLATQQIEQQSQLAETKISNALIVYREAPIQVKAAADAYLQKSVLYRNGLTNMVDVAQAAYALIRAETDRDIAYNNLWQALLLKAAATGDYSLFEAQL